MDKLLIKNFSKVIIPLLLSIWLAVFFLVKIDLTRVDLGRHLKNGQIVYESLLKSFKPYSIKPVLNTNYYSYTHPDYPFVNHHWGGGLIFYIVHKISGFKGLSIFNIILNIFVFLVLFNLALRFSNYQIAVPVALILIPIMAERTEIRPEIFSYCFCAVYLWVLWKFKKDEVSVNWLYALPIMQLLWVNIHVYFIMGIFITGCFMLEFLIKKDFYREKLTYVAVIFVFIVIISTINPFGFRGLLFPFGIFKNYGYRIVENQSVFFLENYGMKNPVFPIFKVISFILYSSFLLVFIKRLKKFAFGIFIIITIFNIMAWLAFRNFTLFGYFALPIVAYSVKRGYFRIDKSTTKLSVRIIAVVSVAVFINSFFNVYKKSSAYYKYQTCGLGLVPDNDKAAKFFLKENIKGPIMNNYDIGSYLIHFLYPEHKVFVDNRPECYPEKFFKETYIPMQENNEIWEKKLKLYDFNTIVYSHHDLTPWGQNFLIQRIDDKEWAPVFADNYSIIFLRKNEQNKELIRKYKLPRNMFSIKKH